MKKLNFIIMSLAILTTITNSYSQNTNQCLEMVYPHEPENGYWNPDSVMVDTCSQSATYGKWYSKKGYEFGMSIYVFGNDTLSMDTTVTWEAISSSFTQIKNGFQNLELEFGPYVIKRSDWNPNDSFFLEAPVLLIEFQNYFEFDSVSNALGDIDSTSKAWMKNIPGIINNVSNDAALIPSTEINGIYCNMIGNDQYWEKGSHPRGYQWHIYDLKCPISWNITKGNRTNNLDNQRNIVSMACAEIYGNWSNHKELYNKNFLSTYELKLPGDGRWDINNNNRTFTNALYIGHPILVISQAIADEDENPMIGTAPDVRGVLISTYKAQLFDLDQEENGVIVHPDVLSISTGAAGGKNLTPEQSGIVSVSSHGNQIGINQFGFSKLENFDGKSNINMRRPHYTNSTNNNNGLGSCILDISDQRKDYRTIYVAGLMDGNLSYNTQGIFESQCYKGQTKFIYGYSHSMGIQKFPSRPEAMDDDELWKRYKLSKMSNARVDLVAPAYDILMATDGYGSYVDVKDGKCLYPENNYDCSLPNYSYNWNPSILNDWNPYDLLEWLDCKCGNHTLLSGDDLINWNRCTTEVMINIKTSTNGNPWYFRQYDAGGRGTSLSSPMVGGIISLMLSVNRFMHLPFGVYNGVLQPGGDGVDPINVHRKVYDILTFTADKLVDDGFQTGYWNQSGTYTSGTFSTTYTYTGYPNYFPDDYPPDYDVTEFKSFFDSHNMVDPDVALRGQPYQFNYVTQQNDFLKRSWAQRMGFGRVNAYRAVAHAIENKGDFVYYNSGDLPFKEDDNGEEPDGDKRGYVNENNEKLMHFGSKVYVDDEIEFAVPWTRSPDSNLDTLNVLDWGGSNKPSYAYFEWEQNDPNNPHNNQGVTYLLSYETEGDPPVPIPLTLEVYENCILAIDGILASLSFETYPLGNIIKTKTNTDGKILTTGFMKDAILKGYLKVSDLFIEGTEEDVAGLIFTDEKEGVELISEIYGHVVLLEDAFITIDDCTTDVQPGGIIEMRGNEDIIVDNGGILRLNGATKIINNENYPDRKIILKNSSKLIVSEGAKVEIMTSLDIEYGSELIIEKNAIVKLNIPEYNASNGIYRLGGKITINEGTHLNFNYSEDNTSIYFSDEVVFNGTPEKKIHITSKLKDFDCCKYICDYNDNIVEDSYVRLYTQPKNWKLPNIEFNNIKFGWFFMIGDQDNSSTFSNCKFVNNSTVDNSNVLLNFSNISQNISVSSCTFQSTYNPKEKKGLNNTIGIQINKCNNIKIESCVFENLFAGVSASSCTFVELTSNTFTDGNIGYLDWGNNSLICSNTFTDINNGCLYALSLGSKNYNNTYTNNRIPIFNWGYSEHDIRNNTFDEYCSGVFSIGGKVNLGEVYKTYVCAYSYGKNIFKVDDDRNSNPYLPPYRTDVEAYPKDVVTIMFGQNEFSEYSDYHLAGDGSLSVMHNNFQPDSTVRYKGFNIYDMIELGTSDTTTNTCDETCSLPSVDWAFYMNRQYCIDSIYRPFNEKMFYLPPGAIGFYEADSMYNYLIEIMNDPSYDCLCRYLMARRALETGLFSSDVYYRLWSLIDDFYYNDCDTSSCKYKLFKAEIFARLNMYDSAMTYYDDLVLNHNDCEDWMIAKWHRLLTLYEFSSDSAITFDLLDSVYVINDTLMAQADSVYTLLMNTLYEDLKNFPDYPKDSVNVAKGTLDFPNQRKLVAYPIYNESGIRNEDSLYYHLVYTKVEDGVSNIYYSRSQPVYYDGITPVPQQDIVWGDYEVKLSDMINCSPYSGTFNCAHPSIVVREDSSGQAPVVKAYVVFSVQNNEPLCKDLFNFGINQHAIAEAVFNANLPEESMTFTYPVVIARGNGKDISQWGTPTINASYEGNYYAWSDSLLGIGVKFKEPDKVYFDQNMQTNYINWSSTYTQQYPSLNTYSRIDQGENEAALVWQEGYDEINTHIYYSRLKVNGNRTLVNNDLPDSIAIKPPPVPIVNADTTILNVSEDEMSNKHPVIYRSIQDGSFSYPTAERSFDRIAWQTDSSNTLPETYNCSSTISYNPKVINNRVITVNRATPQTDDVYPIATIWHEGGKNLRYPTIAQGNYFQAGILNSIITEFNSLNGCDEADESEYVIWHYPHNTYSMGGGYTDIENIGLAKQLSYKGLYPHLAARPFLRDTGSYWQNRRVFLTPDSIISEITVSNEYFAKSANEISYKAVPFYGFDNKQKRMLISSVKVDSKSIPFNLVEFYSDKNWYMKDTIKTEWFKINDISDLDFLQFGDDNIEIKMLIEKKTDKEKTRMDIIPLKPGKVDKAKYKLINGRGYYYRILLVKEANLSQFRENIAIMQWPYTDNTDDGLNKKPEKSINVIDLGHSSLDIEGNSFLLNVFPNPADNVLYVTAYYPKDYVLKYTASDIITIQLYSSIGNKIIEFEAKAGETIQVPLDKYTQGVYFVRVKAKTANLQQQIMPAVKSVVIEK